MVPTIVDAGYPLHKSNYDKGFSLYDASLGP